MKIDNLTLDSKSPLPLVPYFTYDAPGVSRRLSREVANEVCVQNGLARCAVESVLHENYKRRMAEAHDTSEAVRNSFFDQEGTFRGTPEEMSDYVRFRQIDANPYPTIGERVQLFTDPDHPQPLEAYEIFARPRSPEEDILDLSFARDCLKLISQNTATEEGAFRLPKLSRKIIDDGVDQRVVTTKVSVGTFEMKNGDNLETIRLTSRQAGLIDYSTLDPHQQEVVDSLTHYNRERGRTEELRCARAALWEILRDKPVQPVVESLYLTRETEESR